MLLIPSLSYLCLGYASHPPAEMRGKLSFISKHKVNKACVEGGRFQYGITRQRAPLGDPPVRI